MDAIQRWRLRQERAKPIVDRLHAWMLAQRSRVPDGSGTAKVLDYSLKRWVALTRYLDDGVVPMCDGRRLTQHVAKGHKFESYYNKNRVYLYELCKAPLTLYRLCGQFAANRKRAGQSREE